MPQPAPGRITDPITVKATIDDKGKVTLSKNPIVVKNNGAVTITFMATYPKGDLVCDLKLKFDKFKPQASGRPDDDYTVSVSS